MCGHELAVKTAAFIGQHTLYHFNPCLAQHTYSTACYGYKRIARAYYYPWNLRVDDKFGAGWGLAVVRAGFKSHVDGRIGQQPFIFYRSYSINLGMAFAASAVISLSYYPPSGPAITAPTMGLGEVFPNPWRASSSALRMYFSSYVIP